MHRRTCRSIAAAVLPLALACGAPSTPPLHGAPGASVTPPASASSASASAPSTSARPAFAAPPPTEKRPVVSTYHGVSVTDDYRWLEQSDDPAVKKWSADQNDYARKFLDALADRPAVRARIDRLMNATGSTYFDVHHGKKLTFVMRDEPPKQQPYLMALTSVEKLDGARVIVDPNVIDKTGGTTIDWYVPSPDDSLVAVSLSEGGSESGTVHVFEVATGKERKGDRIARAHGGTAGGSLAWRKDGKAFWYTRYPRKGERPEADLAFFQQVWFHTLGTPDSKDTYSIGKTFPRIAEVELKSSPSGDFIMASVANGDGGEFEHWIAEKGGSGAWHRVASYEDRVQKAEFGADDKLYFLSLKDTSGRPTPRGCLIRSSFAMAVAGATVLAMPTLVVPESDGVIESFAVTKNRVYTSELVGGPSRVRIFDGRKARATLLGEAALPSISGVDQLVIASTASDDVLVRSRTFLAPSRWLRISGKDSAVTETALESTFAAKLAPMEVERVMAKASDGVAIPLNVIRKKGTPLDGKNPTILYGYGGYSVSMVPRFRPETMAFVEQGGVYVIANIRGGGEFGEDWHRAGNLTHKQRVFDDFAAAARHLVDAKITSRDRLAIVGGSNGGLLMGAALTQYPELFAAVVSFVGIYDMLRVEETPNGAFNVTEFGTVKDLDQFSALYAYSPYHHVKDGRAYPSVLFFTGENDPRVEPWHSRKMTARLQAAEGTSGLVLLRTSSDTGHGIGSPLAAQIDQEADEMAFIFDRLGHRYQPIAE